MLGCTIFRSLKCLHTGKSTMCSAQHAWCSRSLSRSSSVVQSTEINQPTDKGTSHKENKYADTFSQSEIDKFSKLGGDWWDLDGALKTLHSMNSLRVPFILNGFLNELNYESTAKNPLPLQGMKILDVGCGGGILSEPLARLGAEVTGLDVTPEGIAAALAHAAISLPEDRAPRYLCTSLEQHLADEDCSYDAVVASEVLEHVSFLEDFLSCLCAALRPGGRLTLTTLNRTPQSYVAGIALAEYVLRLLPRGTHEWRKFVPLQELRDMLAQRGLRVEAVHGMYYDPVRDVWCWGQDVSVNYAVRAVKE